MQQVHEVREFHNNAIDPRQLKALEEAELEEKIKQHHGEVKQYINPDLLEWYGDEIKAGVDLVSISKTYVNILAPFGAKLNPENKPVIRLKIGFSKNGAIFVVKPDRNGLNGTKDLKSTAIRMFKVKGIKQLLDKHGWPDVCRATAEWDEQGQMVVVRRPDDGTKRK